MLLEPPSSDDPVSYADKVKTFQEKFEGALGDIAARTGPTEEQRCLILSGGVDTCAILAAAKNIGMTFSAGVTVVCHDDDGGGGNLSPDRDFAIAAAKEHDLEHHIVSVTPNDLVETYLPACIKALNCYDGMTLRNSLVVAAAFHKVSQLFGGRIKHVVVGDGADELMGGYSFTWGNEDDPFQWKEKRDKMCANWTFATEALATMYGLTSHGPYMEPSLVDWVVTNIGRSDCIATRPIRLVHGGERIDHITGKLLLRDSYDTVASWRRKDPIEVGSGVTVIGHDKYWKDIVSDEELKDASEQLLKHGFVIKSKEYLVNFRVFDELFCLPNAENEYSSATNNDIKPTRDYFHPTRKRLGLGKGCAGCCFEIGDQTFCHICGQYPAQRC